MAEEDIQGLLVMKPENVYYLSGLFSTSAALIILGDSQYLLTDSRYFLVAKGLEEIYTLVKVIKSLKQTILEIVKKLGLKKIAFEEYFVSYSVYEQLSRNIKLTQSNLLIEEMRLVKEDEEIERIKKASEITKKSMDQVEEMITPGITERKLASKMDCLMVGNGAHATSFPTIVASGANSAIPHHETTDKIIEQGDFVIIDAGADFEHYQSDMTRTFVAGKFSDKQKELKNIVAEAQRKAITKIKPGILLKDIDKAARDLITDNGYGDNFTHGLGHGIGIEVHEGPVINSSSEKKAVKGMVFSVEPAVYIEGYGGVRIEDTVLVNEDKAQVLT